MSGDQCSAFDFDAPWGAHRVDGLAGAVLWVAQRLPAWASPLARLLRRPVKLFRSRPVDLRAWGFKLRLAARGNMSEQKLWSSPGRFDARERAALRRVLHPGAVFVDIGANAGIYSFWAAHCMAGSGHVVAVEPDPEMRRRMEWNITANGLGCFTVVGCALSDQEGEIPLLVDAAQRGRNTVERAQAEAEGGERRELRVRCRTLLGLAKDLGLERITALKIDIEGHESAVLSPFLEQAPAHLLPAMIVIELKHDGNGGLRRLLQGAGYRASILTPLNVVFVR